MKLFEMFGIGRKQKPLPPIRTVRPPGEARRRRQAAEEARPPAVNQRKEPTMGSVFEDTGSLELEHNLAHEPDQNPYESQSWQRDTNGSLRRADALKSVNRDTKGNAGNDNPYERKIGRKGW